MADTTLSGPLAAVQKSFEELGKILKDTVLNAVVSVTRAFQDMGQVFRVMVPITDVIVRKLKDIGEAFKNAFRENIGERIAAVFKGIKEAILFALPTSVVEYFKSSGGAIATALGSFGKSLGAIPLAAAAAAGAILAFGQATSQFVKLANPAVFEQFTLAVSDLMAVIGRALVPIFQVVVIPVIRQFADVLMNLAPIGTAVAVAFKPLVAILGVAFEIVGKELQKVGEIATRLAPVIAALGGSFLELAKAAGTIYGILIDMTGGLLVEAAINVGKGVKIVAPYLTALAKIISEFATVVVNGARQLASLIGINLSNKPGVELGSSVGAATRSASHSSIDDVVKQSQRSAFSLGAASKGDPAVDTANYAKEIADQAKKIYEMIVGLPERMWAYIKDLPSLIWNYMKELPSLFRTSVTNSVPSASEVGRSVSNVVPGGNLAMNAYQFGRDQLKKPGLFGYTSVNPF